MQGKRVCFISPSAYPLLDPFAGGGWSGGAETQLITIGRALSSLGFDVHFVVDDYGQPESVKFGDVTAHRTTFRHMGGSKLYILSDWWRLFRLLRKIHADFYLIKVPPHLLSLLGLYCRSHGAKLIFIGQKDSDLDENRIRQRQGAPGWWLYRTGIGMTDFVVAQTESQCTGFRDKFGKEVLVIRNVLTLEEDNDISKDDYVLWVGNNNEDKQAHLVPELARALPHVRFRMIMAFGPSQKGDSFIRNQLDELPNLEYLGTVPFSEIADHYKRARLFISTSKCEGFPNTFLQSWQYRTPVISLMVDPDGVIERHDLGRVSGTFDNLVRHIRELHADPAQCEKLGGNARRYAYEHHSLESAVQKYCDLFAGLDATC
ncbi:glycosyltransferase [Sulfuricaulis limicola]|uniref:Glycosyltransferase n=1 Tax=Sulfuricaulis limicola TaxID=1620215 RepID=A0A1B4XGG8_9GAMM|nr:glycosyltransferase [Sulfuricaulis limicola]